MNGQTPSTAPEPKPNVPTERADINKVRRRFRGSQAVWYILGLIEILLVFRFFLKLIGANPEAGFSKFIYGATFPFAEPFVPVVPGTEAGASVFEWTTLIAMVVYALVAWGIVKLMVMSKPVSDVEATKKLEEQE